MIASIITSLINAYILLIFVYVVLSWIPGDSSGLFGQVYGALGALCDPYLDLFKRFIPPLGMVDITPIVGWLVLELLKRIVHIIL